MVWHVILMIVILVHIGIGIGVDMVIHIMGIEMLWYGAIRYAMT